jgi:hypothetical protein
MGKLQKIFYLFFTLSFALTLQAQDSLYFFQYPGQKYVVQAKIPFWEGGYFTVNSFGEVTPYKIHNGKQYFNNPFLKIPLAYQDGKIYWLKAGDIEMLLADISLPSGSTFTGSIPPYENETLTISKTATTYLIQGGNDILYLKKDFGLFQKYYSYTWGPHIPGISSEDRTVREMKYQKPDGSYFVYRLPVTDTTKITFANTLMAPSLKVDINAKHPYSEGLSSGDFWESAAANFIYFKEGADTVISSHPVPRHFWFTFSSTLTLNDSLLMKGYRLKVYFELTDKGVGPNKFRHPKTGAYEIKYLIRTPDFYAKIPDFINYYSRWIISGSDTIYQGVVEHNLGSDTVHEMTVYGREAFLGETFYIRSLQEDDVTYVIYKKVSGVLQELSREKHYFSTIDSSTLHYLLMGEKKIALNTTYSDSTGGAISRVYHFKGGYRGDEEIKYKARTGPILIVRYEPDGLGGAQKVVYKLWKVNNKGVDHIVDNYAEPAPPVAIPTEFSISNNYPNPFNPSTKVRIATVENSVLTFTLFNSNGEEVSSFTKEYAAKGTYEEEINLSGLPSGAWFLSVRDDNGKQLKLLKLLYLK